MRFCWRQEKYNFFLEFLIKPVVLSLFAIQEEFFMQSEIIQINDIDLYYEIHGNGTPLLLLHGFTGSGAALAELFNDMTSQYQLIIPDIRGHGRSTNPSKVFTHRQAALDIESLLEHLKISNCIGIGFSCGGNILLQMAARQTTLLEKMIIISATPYYPNQAREIMRQFTFEDKSKEEWDAMRKIHFHGDEQIKMIWKQANAMSTSEDDINLAHADLAKIKIPTHIIQGDRDPLYPLEVTIEMYRNIPGASLWVIPNGGHVPITPFWLPTFKNYINEISK